MSRPALLIAVFAFLFAPLTADAASLKPYQQAALDKILTTMDPQMQAAARPHLEMTLAGLGEYEVEMMLAAMTTEIGTPAASMAAAAIDAESPVRPVTADDLEFNRAQYEPAIRNAWTASRKFDEVVEAAFGAHCPGRDQYAVFGQAWRYEVYPLQPGPPRASNSADLDVEVLGSSYAPQDGRYRFDFSGVKTTFDQTAVERSIAEACVAYRKIGDEFMADARSRMTDSDLPGGMELERSANARVSEIAAALEQSLNGHAPGSDNGLFNALLSAERLD